MCIGVLMTSCGSNKGVMYDPNPQGNLSQNNGLSNLSVNFLEDRGAKDSQLVDLKTTISHSVTVNEVVTPETKQSKLTWEVEGGVSKDINETKINPEIRDPGFQGSISGGDELFFVARSGSGMSSKYIYKDKRGYLLHFRPRSDYVLALYDITNLTGSFYDTGFENITIQFGHKNEERQVTGNTPSTNSSVGTQSSGLRVRKKGN